jgi:serine protease Do
VPKTENNTVKIVKKILPAVVSVVELEHFKKAGGLPVEISGGSGFIASRDGLVLTNRHVVADAKADYAVILMDGEKLSAKVLSRDPVNDVAILKIEARNKNLPVIPLGDSSQLELGESVIAAGNALGTFKNSVSLGIISGLSRSVAARDLKKKVEELRGLIQTDAAVNPGNSGGPLVNSKGYAVGINVAMVSGAENISFAIPINTAKRDLIELKKYGRIRRPFLGVRYLILDDYLKEKAGLPVAYGALVIREHPREAAVIAGSPAARAGIKEKDIILEINSKRIDADYTIQDFLDNSAVGEAAKLTILRGRKKLQLKVVLAEK